MHVDQSVGANAMEMIQRTLESPLQPGQMGVIMARAGVGKTACLTHIALEHIMRGEPVLHVCIDQTPDKVKVWYHELLKNMTATRPEEDLGSLQQRIDPMRFILAYMHHTFSPFKMERSLRDLREQAEFNPSMVIIDGMNFDDVSRSMIEALQSFAQRNNVSLWLSARTHRHITTTNERGVPYPFHENDDLFSAIMLLDAEPDTIRVKVLKRDERYNPEQPVVQLNAQTYLVQG